MKTFIRSYLYPHERRSLFTILTIGLCLIVFQKTIPKFYQDKLFITEEITDLSSQTTINHKVTEDSKPNNRPYKSVSNSSRVQKKKRNYDNNTVEQKEKWKFQGSPIDLNKANTSELTQLNFSKYALSNLLKYRNAGGSFNSIHDVFKIYGMDSAQVYQIEKHLIFNDRKTKNIKPSVQKNTTAPLIDLNASNASELKAVRGIGDVLSERIIKYRNLLGGYNDVNQLKEVYGLNEEQFETISKQVKTGPFEAVMDINVLNAFQLRKHPYISHEMATVVVNYRTQHGPFFKLADLENIHSLTKEQLDKIIPYLSFKQKEQNTSQ